MSNFIETDPPQTPGSPGNNRIGSRRVQIGADAVDVQREQMGWLDGSGAWHDSNELDPMPVTSSAASAQVAAGDASAVPINATAVLVSFTAGPDYRFRGFMGSGDADAIYALQYDGVTRYMKRSNIVSAGEVALMLPDADPAAAGAKVRLLVTNVGLGTTDFHGVVLGV